MNMLTFAMESESPLYLQLYQYIKSEIRQGRLACNTKLPSKRKLSTHLGISLNTIQAAYDQLIEEGYVISAERKGFYVNKLDHIVRLGVQDQPDFDPQKEDDVPVVYDFSYQGVDFGSFPFEIWRRLTKEIINENDKELVQLGHSQGHFNLRAGIAEYLRQSRGVNCTPDQIVISAGTEFLFQLLIQLLDKDNVYGLENPGYERLSMLFKSNGSLFKPIRMDKNGMIPEEVAKSGANILCITPAHQFPSGGIMPVNRRIQLLNWANENKGRYIIEDDYDSEFKYGGKPIPAMQGLDGNGRVIYMGAFSKSLSPATRVSYMVLPEHLLKRYRENLSFFICPVPSMDQKILHRFIQNGYFERHLNKMRNLYKKKREVLVEEIEKLQRDMEIIGADAGLHLLLRVNNGMTEEQLVSTALNAGVRVYPLSRYYIDMAGVYVRPTVLLGFASLNEEEIRAAVRIIDKCWF